MRDERESTEMKCGCDGMVRRSGNRRRSDEGWEDGGGGAVGEERVMQLDELDAAEGASLSHRSGDGAR